jgi:hypothetical protein
MLLLTLMLLLLLWLSARRGRLELSNDLAGVEHPAGLDLRSHQDSSESHPGE